MNESLLFFLMDLVGIAAFAISGATAAIKRKLDVFGIILIAYITACGGGILRDVIIGATPSANIINQNYIMLSILSALFTIFFYRFINHLQQPVLFFDAIGLSLFCVLGAQKAYLYTHSYLAAVLIGMTTAVGGGVLRDIMLNRVPLILHKEIYALAAILGAIILMFGEYMHWGKWAIWLAMFVCFSLRMLSLKYQWNLLTLSNKTNKDM